MAGTDFEFGFNVRDNLDPWGRNTEAGEWRGTPESGLKHNAPLNSAGHAANQVDLASVSEDWLPEETVEYVLKQIKLMTNTVRKANRMPIIQRGQQQDEQRGAGGRAGQSRRQNGSGGGIQNLGAEHLSTEPKRAKIMGARIPEKWYAVQVKVYVNGNVYFWNLKSTNPNLDKLCDAFGADSDNWTDREFMLANHIDDWNGKAFPTFIEPVIASSGKSKK